MVKEIVGNIFAGEASVILQIVNCRGVADTELFKKIKRKYPSVYRQYIQSCREDARLRKNLCMTTPLILGDVQCCSVENATNESGINTVVNIFVKDEHISKEKRRIYYSALRLGLYRVNEMFKGAHLSIPYHFECDDEEWETVSGIMEEALIDCDIAMYQGITPKYTGRKDV